MSTPRMIKKYPNRRLYDTTESRYITRADVQKMVIDRVDFVVVDKNTREDITRSILLQIISQQEDRSDPVMSRDFLSRVIRSHEAAARGMTASYLEQSMKLLTAQLEVKPPAEAAADSAAMDGLAEQHYRRWRAVQEEIRRTLLDAASSLAPEAPAIPPQTLETGVVSEPAQSP